MNNTNELINPQVMNMSDPDFFREVELAIQLYEDKIGHGATRTREMIKTCGAVEALSRLMVSADRQQGFKVLRDSNQLDKSFEALVTRYPQFSKRNLLKRLRGDSRIPIICFNCARQK
jgi:hypothetical protein